MIRFVVIACLLAAAPAFAADAAPTASGVFRSQAIMLEVRGAVAFRGKSFFDDGRALIVAVSNVNLRAAAIGDYVDRRRAIAQRVMDDRTGVVWLEFKPDGTYRGMSYYFQQGNGCAFCTGEVTSTVRLVDGKLSGRLTDAEKDRSFDVTLATPIMSDEHGAALPADGGAPGKAYLQYHAALAKSDRAALHPLLSNEQQQFLDEAEKNGNLAETLQAMADGHPGKAVRITGGFIAGDKAVLLIAGEGTTAKLTGEVLMLREGGAWHVDDELTARE
jgi:hypothetical protein